MSTNFSVRPGLASNPASFRGATLGRAFNLFEPEHYHLKSGANNNYRFVRCFK